MMNTAHFEHELFLLLINLSQMTDETATRKLFIDSMNWLGDQFQLTFIENQTDASGECIEIATARNRFGFIDVTYSSDSVDKSLKALVRNAITMLSMILEKQYQDKLLADETLLLKKLVARQTRDLEAANREMKREIEQRKQITRQLEKSKFFIQKILDMTPNLIYIYDLMERKNIFTNKEVTTFLGYDEQQIQAFGSRMMESIIYPEDMPRVIAHHQQMLSASDNQILELDYRVVHRDGTLRWLHSKDLPFSRSADGTVKHILGIAEDVTEKKEAEKIKAKLEAQLRHTQKMEAIGVFAGGIAHDFNNLLGVITGNISYALSQMDEGNALYPVLADIQQGARQAQNLTQQLLTFAKGGEPIKKVVQLDQHIKSSAEFVSSGTRSKCRFNLATDLWLVEVDIGQINQVISNLVINADQAMPKGGTIILSAKNVYLDADNKFQLPKGRYVRIAIQDQGIGIPEKYIANIFDPYFTTKQKGSGLGLATAYSIVHRHGGHIGVYSEVGHGTEFTIHLPALAEQVPSEKPKTDRVHRGKGHVLIMDDQKPILDMLGRLLDLMGYTAEFALDGREAIEKYRKAFQTNLPFDLVILDLTVPGGMGGAEAMAELLEIDPNVKAIVSSGYSNDPIMANYRDYRFCGVVPKPYTRSQLSEILDQIFQQ